MPDRKYQVYECTYQIKELLVFAHLLQVNANQNHNQSYQDLNHQNQRCSKSYPS